MFIVEFLSTTARSLSCGHLPVNANIKSSRYAYRVDKHTLFYKLRRRSSNIGSIQTATHGSLLVDTNIVFNVNNIKEK